MLLKYGTLPFCDAVQGNPLVLPQSDGFEFCKDVTAAREAPGLSPPMAAGPARIAGRCPGQPNGVGGTRGLEVGDKCEGESWLVLDSCDLRGPELSPRPGSSGQKAHSSFNPSEEGITQEMGINS